MMFRAALTKLPQQKNATLAIALAGVVIALFWLAFALWAINLRSDVRDRTSNALSGQRDMIAEEVSGVYRTVETFLTVVNHWISTHPERDPRTDPGLAELVEKFQRLTNHSMLFRMATRDGNLHLVPQVAGARSANVADRDYFVAAMREKPGQLTFGMPFQGRATGKWVTSVATRVSRPAHGITVMLVAVEQSVFDTMFAKVRMDEGSTISLIRRDGVLLARSATDPRDLGQNLSSSVVFTEGLAKHTSGVVYADGKMTDAVPMMTAYSILERYPMVVTISSSTAGIERGTHGMITLVAGMLALLSLLVTAVARQFVLIAGQSEESRRAALAIEAREHHLRTVIDLVPHFIFAKNVDGYFTLANRAVADAYGTTPEDLVGKSDRDFNPNAEQVAHFAAADQEVIRSGRAKLIPDELITDASGQTRHLQTIKIPYRALDTEVMHVLGVATDITRLKQAETRLRIAATAFDSQESIMVTDAKAVILQINDAFTKATGYTAEDIVGLNPRLLKSGHHDAEFYREMWSSLLNHGSWQGEIWGRHKNGQNHPRWLVISAVRDEAGVTTHYVGTYYDLSERKQAEERINALAFYDQLTQLPNRILFLDRLGRVMANSARADRFGALLLIDLDHFKLLNDTQGHEIGDQLLKLIAGRLKQCIREEETLARLGGDEFVVLLDDLAGNEKEAASVVEAVAEKILGELNQTYQIGSLAHHNTASIGVTLFKGHTSSVDDVMKQADLAMYRAKAAGRNMVRFFDTATEEAVKRQAEMESGLRNALAGNQLLLHYQAQILDDRRVTGAEVLVRWKHPERGLISPAEFIPLAEQTGLIIPIGNWVLETACRRLAAWAQRPELSHLTISVNVSAQQFRQEDFIDQVLDIVAQTKADPRRLKLELTESMLVQDIDDVIAKMYVLKSRGIGFSLDDFGTGYSSLSYLKQLPLDQLKIDQSFVRDVLSDPNDAVIARAIVALGQSLGLAVIAEGVETASQRDFLAAAGCHAYQGYFFSRPVMAGEFEQLVRRQQD